MSAADFVHMLKTPVTKSSYWNVIA